MLSLSVTPLHVCGMCQRTHAQGTIGTGAQATPVCVSCALVGGNVGDGNSEHTTGIVAALVHANRADSIRQARHELGGQLLAQGYTIEAYNKHAQRLMQALHRADEPHLLHLPMVSFDPLTRRVDAHALGMHAVHLFQLFAIDEPITHASADYDRVARALIAPLTVALDAQNRLNGTHRAHRLLATVLGPFSDAESFMPFVRVVGEDMALVEAAAATGSSSSNTPVIDSLLMEHIDAGMLQRLRRATRIAVPGRRYSIKRLANELADTMLHAYCFALPDNAAADAEARWNQMFDLFDMDMWKYNAQLFRQPLVAQTYANQRATWNAFAKVIGDGVAPGNLKVGRAGELFNSLKRRLRGSKPAETANDTLALEKCSARTGSPQVIAEQVFHMFAFHQQGLLRFGTPQSSASATSTRESEANVLQRDLRTLVQRLDKRLGTYYTQYVMNLFIAYTEEHYVVKPTRQQQ